MKPSLPRRSCSLLVAAALALGALAGCDKTADEDDAPPTRQAEATPTLAPDRNGRKALSAYNAVSNYLKEQDPGLREHLQKAASHFVKDKDKWRERLQNRQRDLQPKIARLREQLAKADGQTADALHRLKQELASLESQRAEAEHKLSQLESITSDTWKSFREQLADDGEPAGSPTPGNSRE